MIIKSESELTTLKTAGELSTKILSQLVDLVKVGVLPSEIDSAAKRLCSENDVVPSFMGVKNAREVYKYATCISVNDTVVHGIPDDSRKLSHGDLVKIDFGIVYKGFCTDHCVTVGIKPVKNEDIALINAGKEAVEASVGVARAGNTIGDIGATMTQVAKKYGFRPVKSFTGHGIGKKLHENPSIPVYGKFGEGEKLKEGMVVCVESQLVPGRDDVWFADDGWTVKTEDGAKAVMFEYMIVITKDEPIILTDTRNWNVLV